MKLALTFLVLFCAAFLTGIDAGARELVLVTQTASDLPALKKRDMRRLFLGYKNIQGASVTAIINDEDKQLQKLFLQNIVFMSESNYQKQLLRGALQQGLIKPKVLGSTQGIADALGQDTEAVSFMWKSDVARHEHLRLVQTVWVE